jgi:fibronectin type 3 domain-containing protein
MLFLFPNTAWAHDVLVNWTVSTSPGITGQNIYRSTGSGFSILATVDAVTTSYDDTTVVDGLTYGYAVTSFDGAGHESVLSNIANVSIPTPPVPPIGPTPTPPAFVSVTLKGTKFITVQWVAGTPLAACSVQSFNVYRSSDSINFLLRATVGVRSNYWKDSRITRSTSYGYRVTAFSKACGESLPTASGLVVVP